jgi:hypothetical protein
MSKPVTALVSKLARLEAAAATPRDAAATYQRNFGFQVRDSDAAEATVVVGDAEIHLSPAGAGREGMTALQLATDDLDRLIDALRLAGIEPEFVTSESGRRAIRIPAHATGNVPLVVIERKS